MLNKSILIGIAVAVVIAIAVGALTMDDPNSSDVSELPEESSQTEVEEPQGRALTLEFSESVATTATP